MDYRINLILTDGGDYDIYVMNANGSNILRLTDEPGYDGWPSW